jgi:hypothetical protein
VAYAVAVPVSRKRKNRKSGQKRSGGREVRHPEETLAAMAEFAGYQRWQQDHRQSLALKTADTMITELAGKAASLSDSDLEDELCLRIGRSLADGSEDAPLADYVSPNTLAEGVIQAAANAVGSALAADGADWTPAWRVLTAAAGIVNFPLSDQADTLIEGLRAGPGGSQLPQKPTGPIMTGPALWTRDAYGSRFAVVAPLRRGDGPQRWYLWDIDACGHHAFTVHSGYHATPQEALADWQAGVGAPAADGTILEPVGDPQLLHEVMPHELGMMNPGGENVRQFAEYHRSKRLAEAVLGAVESQGRPAQTGVNPDTAVALFRAWLREHRSERSQQDGLDELIAELVDSWHIGGPRDLFHTCSPHRVAFVAQHVGEFYQEDFAAEIIALLPDWTAWLADRYATPAHLADRCRPYADGQPYFALRGNPGGPSYLARVKE